MAKVFVKHWTEHSLGKNINSSKAYYEEFPSKMAAKKYIEKQWRMDSIRGNTSNHYKIVSSKDEVMTGEEKQLVKEYVKKLVSQRKLNESGEFEYTGTSGHTKIDNNRFTTGHFLRGDEVYLIGGDGEPFGIVLASNNTNVKVKTHDTSKIVFKKPTQLYLGKEWAAFNKK